MKKICFEPVARVVYSMAIASVLIGCANQTSMEKSIDSLVEEANEGRINAAHALCYRFSNGANVEQDYQKAFEWCTKASATQNPKSMTLLADLYYHGNGTEQNYRKAAKLYYYAADRGVEKAMLMLYHHYQNGFGVAKDEKEARYYLNRAAQRNYQPAIMLKQELMLNDTN